MSYREPDGHDDGPPELAPFAVKAPPPPRSIVSHYIDAADCLRRAGVTDIVFAVDVASWSRLVDETRRLRRFVDADRHVRGDANIRIATAWGSFEIAALGA